MKTKKNTLLFNPTTAEPKTQIQTLCLGLGTVTYRPLRELGLVFSIGLVSPLYICIGSNMMDESSLVHSHERLNMLGKKVSIKMEKENWTKKKGQGNMSAQYNTSLNI